MLIWAMLFVYNPVDLSNKVYSQKSSYKHKISKKIAAVKFLKILINFRKLASYSVSISSVPV